MSSPPGQDSRLNSWLDMLDKPLFYKGSLKSCKGIDIDRSKYTLCIKYSDPKKIETVICRYFRIGFYLSSLFFGKVIILSAARFPMVHTWTSACATHSQRSIRERASVPIPWA